MNTSLQFWALSTIDLDIKLHLHKFMGNISPGSVLFYEISHIKVSNIYESAWMSLWNCMILKEKWLLPKYLLWFPFSWIFSIYRRLFFFFSWEIQLLCITRYKVCIHTSHILQRFSGKIDLFYTLLLSSFFWHQRRRKVNCCKELF